LSIDTHDRATRRGAANRFSGVALAACLAVILAAPSTLAEGPAVSAPNTKFSVEGGSLGGDGTFIGLGSYAMPLGHAYGLQFDGALGTLDGALLGGGGVHLFTRDPSHYLFGGYASFHSWNGIDVWRAATEAEFYYGVFTFSGLAGIEGISGGSSSSDGRFFGKFDLSYYATEDLRLSAGLDHASGTTMGTAGVEYLIREGLGTPVSLFARGRFGASSFQSLTGGLRVHFGADPAASLRTRHRTADPDNHVPNFSTAMKAGGNYCTVDRSLDPERYYYPLGSCTCPPDMETLPGQGGDFFCRLPTSGDPS